MEKIEFVIRNIKIGEGDPRELFHILCRTLLRQSDLIMFLFSLPLTVIVLY